MNRRKFHPFQKEGQRSIFAAALPTSPGSSRWPMSISCCASKPAIGLTKKNVIFVGISCQFVGEKNREPAEHDALFLCTRRESPAIRDSKICMSDYKRATGGNGRIEGGGERKLSVYVVRQLTGKKQNLNATIPW